MYIFSFRWPIKGILYLKTVFVTQLLSLSLFSPFSGYEKYESVVDDYQCINSITDICKENKRKNAAIHSMDCSLHKFGDIAFVKLEYELKFRFS